MELAKLLKQMVGPGGLEPLTSSVSRKLGAAGTRRINRLGLRLSATVGFIGQRWLVFVQRFVQRCTRRQSLFPTRRSQTRRFSRLVYRCSLLIEEFRRLAEKVLRRP